ASVFVELHVGPSSVVASAAEEESSGPPGSPSAWPESPYSSDVVPSRTSDVSPIGGELDVDVSSPSDPATEDVPLADEGPPNIEVVTPSVPDVADVAFVDVPCVSCSVSLDIDDSPGEKQAAPKTMTASSTQPLTRHGRRKDKDALPRGRDADRERSSSDPPRRLHSGPRAITCPCNLPESSSGGISEG